MKNAKNVEAYLAERKPNDRTVLAHVRSVIKSLHPDLVEGISYGMPGFKLNGSYVGGYAAFANHLSLFPTGEPVAAFRDELTGYKLSKGTVQFTAEHPVPDALIRKLYQHRIDAILRAA